jgi:hypothetical protein
MPALSIVAPLMLILSALVLFALFYGLVLVNNIMGRRFERSLHASPFPDHRLPVSSSEQTSKSYANASRHSTVAPRALAR